MDIRAVSDPEKKAESDRISNKLSMTIKSMRLGTTIIKRNHDLSIVGSGLVPCISNSSPKGPTKNNFPFWDADPSRLAALFVAQISRYSSLLAPRQAGASTPEKGNLFLAGP